MAAEPAPGSVGLLYHACLEEDFLLRRRRIGHAVLLADKFLGRPESWPALKRLGSFVPLLSHGVGLSLGSAEGLDAGYVGRLAEFLSAVRPAWHGEHASFSRAGGRDVGHFVPLPRDAGSARLLAANARAAQAGLPCPLLLENVAAPFDWGGTWDEADFMAELAERSACRLLLDLHNLHANAVNFGFDAATMLGHWPLEAVAEVHAAGGLRRGGWLVDSHTRPPPAEVHALLGTLGPLGCAAPVTLEWDEELPAFDGLLSELERLRAALRPPGAQPGRLQRSDAPGMDDRSGLAERQARFARAMLEPCAGDALELGLGEEAVVRARDGYALKRARSPRNPALCREPGP